MIKKNDRIIAKTPEEIKIMAEGGKKLARIKKKLVDAIGEGVNAQEIEKLAERLVVQTGGASSFKMVPGYSWATCINVNEGVVHGVPKKEIVFKKGDIVSVDLGLFYKDFHTDTSFTVGIKPDKKLKGFLNVGESALTAAINETKTENRVYDISKAIQETVEGAGYRPVRALVGHGIGKDLHEEPQIPCFVKEERSESPEIPEGAVLAIEVMYTNGKPDVVLAEDGWTITTQDGKIAALFEETVAVSKNGPVVLTHLIR
jgi:methionyl aminopeptidase